MPTSAPDPSNSARTIVRNHRVYHLSPRCPPARQIIPTNIQFHDPHHDLVPRTPGSSKHIRPLILHLPARHHQDRGPCPSQPAIRHHLLQVPRAHADFVLRVDNDGLSANIRQIHIERHRTIAPFHRAPATEPRVRHRPLRLRRYSRLRKGTHHGLLHAGSRELAAHLGVAKEVTADRFGLLAAQDLDAALRLEMVATTGLSGSALSWDTKAYLAQCREVMEQTLAKGEQALASTHPEHSLWAWAVALFYETDVYRSLTGTGPGTRKLAEVDELIERALLSTTTTASIGVRGEPPMFLLGCALTACVLVAHADGEVVDEESNTLLAVG